MEFNNNKLTKISKMAKAQTRTTNTKKNAPKKASSNSKLIKKVEKKTVKETKWNQKKATVGDFFSCHQYMKVSLIKGSDITLLNERGEKVEIDVGVLRDDSYSADHYEKEITCNMTELSEIL